MADSRPYKDRPFSSRFSSLGDEAESVFREVYNGGFEDFGLRRPKVNLAMIPAKIRYTPDFITSFGFVEVQGIGKDQTYKLKVEKYAALNEWHTEWKVDLFTWDSHRRRYGYMGLHDFFEAWETEGDLGQFREGRRYLALQADKLPINEWVKHDRR